MKRILCLWLPNWPVQRLTTEAQQPIQPTGGGFKKTPRDPTADDPAPDQHALAGWVIYEREPRRGLQIKYCCPVAEQLGFFPGMSLAEASAIRSHATQRSTATNSKSRPAVRFVNYDPHADEAALRGLAGRCHRYSPAVGLENADPPCSLLLDITGSAPRLGGTHRLSMMLARDFWEQGYVVQIAVANTIGAAWAVAHYAADFLPSDSCYPTNHKASQTATSHCFLVPPGESVAYLSALPIQSLRLQDNTIETLQKLGVFQIDQLLKLPRSGLTSRFGPDLLTRLDQALGRVAEPMVLAETIPPVRYEQCLEHPTARQDVLEAWLQHLLAELTAPLVRQNRGILQLDCQLHAASPPPQNLRIGLFQPTATIQHLLDLLRMQLEQQRLRAPIVRIVMEATLTVTTQASQRALFDDQAAALVSTSTELMQLINRLSSRLGQAAVNRVRLFPNVLPEDSYQYERLTGNQRKAAHPPRAAQRAGFRPLHVMRVPIPLHQVTVDDHGKVATFSYRDACCRIQHIWGPERLETRWWEGNLIARDYFRVEDQLGHRFWVFRDLQQGNWFLHGEF